MSVDKYINMQETVKMPIIAKDKQIKFDISLRPPNADVALICQFIVDNVEVRQLPSRSMHENLNLLYDRHSLE